MPFDAAPIPPVPPIPAVPAVPAAVAYHDLRLAKEGVATADLVKVFE